MSKIAIIRIRGSVKLKKEIKDTLSMLKLYKKHYCTVYESTLSIIGMIKKVQDYVTYGEIDDNTVKELIEKRGEEYTGPDNERTKRKFVIIGDKKYKAYFRLNPPKGGFGSIKKSVNVGGALGLRKDMAELIKRML